MAGLGACLGVITLMARIWGSRIELNANNLTVVNPVLTYKIPYGAVKEVRGGGGASLNMALDDGGEVYSTAFGGSVIDGFVNSSGRAAEVVRKTVKERRGRSGGSVERRLTHPIPSTCCLVGSIACWVAAGVLGV